MKRVSKVYEQLISNENLLKALQEVNKTHRWHPKHRKNKIVDSIDKNPELYIEKLRTIIENGFTSSPVTITRRWDKSACKWRDISEPRLWPDQYIHHAIIQILQPVIMRGMDRHCCGSIKGRGIHYGVKLFRKWMKDDEEGTKYCMELDIYHFYENIQPDMVMKRLKVLVKDQQMLDICGRIMKDGVLIGAYFSQWFANMLLQPLDMLIRQSGKSTHYIRYMDNLTIFSNSKEELQELLIQINNWLNSHELQLKNTYQIFPTNVRTPQGLGYRYSKGRIKLRKRNLLRLKRQIHQFCIRKTYSLHFACGLISRIGQLKHCNHTQFFSIYVPKKMIYTLKNIIRIKQKEMRLQWSIL